MDDHTRARLDSLQAAVTAFRKERDALELSLVALANKWARDDDSCPYGCYPGTDYASELRAALGACATCGAMNCGGMHE